MTNDDDETGIEMEQDFDGDIEDLEQQEPETKER